MKKKNFPWEEIGTSVSSFYLFYSDLLQWREETGVSIISIPPLFSLNRLSSGVWGMLRAVLEKSEGLVEAV